MTTIVQDGLHFLPEVQRAELPCYEAENGELVVMEEATHVPFKIARVFSVCAPLGAVRGMHAHRSCAQFLVCVSGAIEVVCDDGNERQEIALDRPGLALLVPPSIWAEEIYRERGSVMVVLCDRKYEAEDYIRDYDEFKSFRASRANRNGVST
jgi:dTDP-4-dehydrorhamnose 3,5-epimerase-like enzyme